MYAALFLNNVDIFLTWVDSLSRVFLKSRSGVHRLDSILTYLIRTAIQTGILATAWAIAALVAFFFLPKITVYRIFDMTSGTVYMRVSDYPAAQLSHLKGYIGSIRHAVIARPTA